MCVPMLQEISGNGCMSVTVSQQRWRRDAMTRPQAQQMRRMQRFLCKAAGISSPIRCAKQELSETFQYYYNERVKSPANTAAPRPPSALSTYNTRHHVSQGGLRTSLPCRSELSVEVVCPPLINREAPFIGLSVSVP